MNAMSPSGIAALVGLIVVAGKWSQKKEITINTAVGVMVFAISLSIINQFNPKFAMSMGMIAVVAAALLPPDGLKGKETPYVISIVKGLGWSK